MLLYLNVLGTMSNLIRTKQGTFTLDDSYNLQDISNNKYNLLTIKQIFNYPQYKLNEEEYYKVKNGVPLKLNKKEEYLILEYNNEVIAIYKLNNNIYKSYFML